MWPVVKALGLHGNTQTGEIFQTRLDPFLSRLSKSSNHTTEWAFPDGPVALEKQEGDDVNRRSWYLRKGLNSADDVTPKTFPLDDAFLKPFNVIFGFSQGGIVAVAAALKSDAVRLCIVAGAPDADWIDAFAKQTTAGKARYLKIIFLAGETDEIVPPNSTKKLFERVRNLTKAECHFETFAGNHFFPVTSKHCDDYLKEFAAWLELAGSIKSCEAQREELDILQSIYQESLSIGRDAPAKISDPCLHVSITISPAIRLDCSLLADYPLIRSAHVTVVATVTEAGSERRRMSLQRVADEALKPLQGEMQLFACAAAVQDALAQYPSTATDAQEVEAVEEQDAQQQQQQTEEENEDETNELVRGATQEARAKVLSSSNVDDLRQGHWNPFCIGLLGKPSAGKSSFFNACTQNALQGRKQAEVGAAPFTTIDPNFGAATCTLRPNFEVPLLIKDVAGLVPGAYKGLGKGNRFLNDLLDASVLLHICDGTGSADEGGRIIDMKEGRSEVSAELGSPEQVTKDALWVLKEVHMWIYGNVTAKWPQQKKNRQGSTSNQNKSMQEKTVTNRICQLFAGYHASPSVTCRAARLAGLDLERAVDFTQKDRHRLCAHFIAVRFPVVLVLNKFDSFAMAENQQDKARSIINESKRMMGDDSLVVSVSAKLENDFLALVASNDIQTYDSATANLTLSQSSSSAAKVAPLTMALKGMVFNGGEAGTTGVHLALVRGVDAARPLICTALTTGISNQQKMFLMYPGSTVYDLYEACLRAQFVAGDFVRAEEVGENGASGKTLSRDAPLRDHLSVRIATNKRVIHQQKATMPPS